MLSEWTICKNIILKQQTIKLILLITTMTNKKIEFFNDVHACLKHLELIGWGDSIESRYEDRVTEELKYAFPEISEEVINKTLELVLV